MTGWRKRQVIELVLEAGWDAHHAEFDTRFERFAELVRADERERVLKIIDDQGTWAHTGDLVELVKENT